MSNTSDNLTDTGNGHLQGVQPAQPRLAADWGPTTAAQQVAQQQPLVQPVQQPAPQYQEPTGGESVEERLARARREEKDKLYPQIDELTKRLSAFEADREAERLEKERLAQEAADARRMKEESEMDLRALLEKRDQEFRQQLEETNRRYETDRAVFEKERALADAQAYMRDRLEQEREFILPEMRQFVRGDTPEQIDESIEEVKRLTESVFTNLAAGQEPAPAPFQQPRGASPTAPPVGPMEQLPSYQSLTPEDIAGMDMETYKRYRGQLLPASNPYRG